MNRSYSKRVYETAKSVEADGDLVTPINLKSDTRLNVLVRATYEATHDTTTGLGVSGRYGIEDANGNIIWDTSTAPTDFGDVVVETEASEEVSGALQFKVPVLDVPQHLQLTVTNKDVTNPCVVDIIGCA